MCCQLAVLTQAQKPGNLSPDLDRDSSMPVIISSHAAGECTQARSKPGCMMSYMIPSTHQDIRCICKCR